MEEARLLELQARVYQKSGNVEETLKTLTRAKEVQTRWTTANIICPIILAFLFVLTYNLLEDRRMYDVINTFVLLYY